MKPVVPLRYDVILKEAGQAPAIFTALARDFGEIEPTGFLDHYNRFLYYHYVILLNQLVHSQDYRSPLKVVTLVISTFGNQHWRYSVPKLFIKRRLRYPK
jgi:hypothetical protein